MSAGSSLICRCSFRTGFAATSSSATAIISAASGRSHAGSILAGHLVILVCGDGSGIIGEQRILSNPSLTHVVDLSLIITRNLTETGEVAIASEKLRLLHRNIVLSVVIIQKSRHALIVSVCLSFLNGVLIRCFQIRHTTLRLGNITTILAHEVAVVALICAGLCKLHLVPVFSPFAAA